ncbi:bestrophin-4 [Daphnia magna]|uniref:bestrophin-4 n=1 Tax=Daphnia magna TaxID=35525 RepID=UPI001E1BAA52|nr:bestrophin-4 [Daphnia magna]
MSCHRSLDRARTFQFTTVDAASMPLTQQFSFRKKSDVMIVPSLQAVKRTAPNARYFDSIKTLFRWKGSIYRLVWRHFLLYYVLYVTLSLIYEFVLNNSGKRHFEAVTRYFSKSASTLNLMIMLGFFTSTTLQRLFTMQTAVPGTAKTISTFLMSLKTDLPEGSIIVFQYARWAVLSWILALRSVCKPLRKKYPDMISLQRKGLLRPFERLILERAETDGELTPRPLIVIDWMLLLLKECLTYGRYNNKSSHHKNVEMLLAFKKSCGNMIKFATKNMPHAVIQAVILAVYYFGLVTMMARDLSSPLPIPYQSLQAGKPDAQGESFNEDSVDEILTYKDTSRPDQDVIVKAIILYVPLMPLMQFFIFFAWLTFGRMAVNPFGEDETDIDIEHLLQSHIDDYRRLGTLYSLKLENLFPDLPQKRFFDVAQTPEDNEGQAPKTEEIAETKSPVLYKMASSPEIGSFSVLGSTAKDERKRKQTVLLMPNRDATCITIDDTDHIRPEERNNSMW